MILNLNSSTLEFIVMLEYCAVATLQLLSTGSPEIITRWVGHPAGLAYLRLKLTVQILHMLGRDALMSADEDWYHYIENVKGLQQFFGLTPESSTYELGIKLEYYLQERWIGVTCVLVAPLQEYTPILVHENSGLTAERLWDEIRFNVYDNTLIWRLPPNHWLHRRFDPWLDRNSLCLYCYRG
jgi:hypothetical protein